MSEQKTTELYSKLAKEIEHIDYMMNEKEVELQYSHMYYYFKNEEALLQYSTFLIEPLFLKMVYSDFLKNLRMYLNCSTTSILLDSYEFLKRLRPDESSQKDLLDYALLIANACFLEEHSSFGKTYVLSTAVKKLRKYEEQTTRLSDNEAMRDNSSKIDHNLFQAAISDFADCLDEGAKKYSANNWKKSMDVNQIKNSLINHLEKFLVGEINDIDSGNTHISHILCNCMFLEYHLNKSEVFLKLRENPKQNQSIS